MKKRSEALMDTSYQVSFHSVFCGWQCFLCHAGGSKLHSQLLAFYLMQSVCRSLSMPEDDSVEHAALRNAF